MESLFGSHHPTQQHTLTSPSAPVRLYFRDDGTTVYNPAGSISPTAYQPGVVGGTNRNVGNGFDGGVEVDGSAQQQMIVKRKRGRTRKYGPYDGSNGPLLPPPSGESGGSRGRGRGEGEGEGEGGIGAGVEEVLLGWEGRIDLELQMQLQREKCTCNWEKWSTGSGFAPHVITVKAGEDVSARVMSFSQPGPRSICILTANGAISNVTLHRAATSGGIVTYEGRFEILSLSGSFLSESGGQRSRTGGLSVSLAGPDGCVLGDGVAGLLTAASPVQVIVGSFAAEGMKEAKLSGFVEPSLRQVVGGANTTDSPASSRGTLSRSAGMPMSPLSQNTGAFNHNNVLGLAHLPLV